MTNSFSLVRSLITYGVCLALAILVGYLSANTATDFVSFLMVIALLGLLMVPLFLRWHYAWLLLAWNMDAVLFFVSGKPYLGWVMILVSFTISMLHYIIDRRAKFISTPSISRPLWFLLAVILVTAWLTGGIGLNALGSSDVGGKRYIQLILAVIGFFALTAVRIPPHKRRTYISLYFAGTLSLAVA